MTQSIPGAGLLAGKTAIITGSAMGLGKAMAAVFVREGAKVLAVDFDPANASAHEGLGPDCVAFEADVTDEDAVAAMFAKARELFGHVDILINNAGTIWSENKDQLATENYERFTQTNFFGVVLCTRYAVEAMTAQGGGAIVNVSSVGSLNTEDRAPLVYSAAKAAVNSLTKSIAVKHGAQGIRCNALLPGFTYSEKTRAAPREIIQPMTEKASLGRAGEPEEQAQVAAFLASDRASYVNGAVIPVDGGWSARMV